MLRNFLFIYILYILNMKQGLLFQRKLTLLSAEA